MTKKKINILTLYVANKIEERRATIGLTQHQVADKTTISRTTFTNIENGRHGLSLDSLYEIANALDCEVGELLPPMAWYQEYKGKQIKKVVTWEIED